MLEEKVEVVIADDDVFSMKILEIYLGMMDGVKLIGRAKDGKELIDIINEKEPQLAIVDINTPAMTGFDAIRECLKLQPHLLVIFVTGIETYAAKAFELDAVDYIIKPLEIERLKRAFQRAKDRIQMTKQRLKEERLRQITTPENKTHTLVIKMDYIITRIPLDEIIYIEKEKNGKRVRIHTKEKTFNTYDTLAALLERLDYNFLKVHRSYIANMKHVSELISKGNGTLYELTFQNSKDIAFVSKTFVQDVKDFLAICE